MAYDAGMKERAPKGKWGCSCQLAYINRDTVIVSEIALLIVTNRVKDIVNLRRGKRESVSKEKNPRNRRRGLRGSAEPTAFAITTY